LLGTAAISVGNARRALRVAETYASERHQGGARIANHTAVQRLLGDARSGITMAASQVEAAAACEGAEAVWLAAAAKLRVAEICRTSVSDCMQVLGGYGYMEDYPIEKCLRDAMTLVATGIDPGTLRLMCAQDPFGINVGHA
jgi:alkylation response protein AidB-like acyl-CoA dehydrogenase